MKIKTHQQILGVPPSTVVEVDDEEGAKLILGGYASKAEGEPNPAPEKPAEVHASAKVKPARRERRG